MNKPLLTRRLILAATAASLLARSASANPDALWNGGAGGDSWSAPQNWVLNGLPFNSVSTPSNVVFGAAGSLRLSPNVDAPWSLGRISFASGAASYTLGGQELSIGAGSEKGIVVDAANVQTINNAITLLASQSFSGAGAGELRLGGAVTVGAFALSLDHATRVQAGGGIASISTGGLTVNAPLTLDAATLQVAASSSFTLASGLTLQNGATATISKNVTLTAASAALSVAGAGSSLTISGNGRFDSAVPFTVSAGGAATFSGYLDLGAYSTATGTPVVNVTGANSQLTINGAGSWWARAGHDATVTVQNGGHITHPKALEIANGGNGSDGILNVLSGGIFTFGDANLPANFQIANTTATATAQVSVSGANSRLEMLGAATATIGGASGSAATVVVSDTATFSTGTGTTTIKETGSLTSTTGGVLLVNGDLTVRGLLSVTPVNGNELTVALGKTLRAEAGGHLNFIGGVDAGLPTGFYSVVTSFQTVVTDAGSTLHADADVIVYSNGQITASSGGLMQTNSDLILGYAGTTGNVTVAGGGAAVTAAQSVILGEASGSLSTLSIQSGGSVTTAATILNSTGRIVLSGGTANLGTLTPAGGLLTFTTGTLNVANSLTVGGAGPIISAPVLSSGSGMIVGGTLTNSTGSSLVLDGGILSAGNFVNNGTLQWTRGTLAQTGAGSFTVGSGGLLGPLLALGTGQTLQVANALVVAAGGNFTLAGGTLTTGGLTNAGDTTISSGLGSVTGALTNASTGQLFLPTQFAVGGASTNSSGGRIILQNGTGRLTGAGVLTNSGLITGDGRIDKPVTNAAGGELRGEAGKTLNFTGPTGANAGTINYLGGTIEFSQALTNGPAGTIQGRGVMNFAGGLTQQGKFYVSGGLSDISGAINQTAGGDTIISGAAVATFYGPYTNNGTRFRTSTGSRTVFFAPVNGATAFSGSGTVSFEGGYSPGNSPAIIDNESSIVFESDNILTMEIGGLTAGPGTPTDNGYDRLIFSATAAPSVTWGGTLRIDLINNFAPAMGMSFDLFDFNPGLAAGLFGQIVLAPGDTLAPGLSFDTSQLYVNGMISVVPEPSAAALLLGGLALLGFRRRGGTTSHRPGPAATAGRSAGSDSSPRG